MLAAGLTFASAVDLARFGVTGGSVFAAAGLGSLSVAARLSIFCCAEFGVFVLAARHVVLVVGIFGAAGRLMVVLLAAAGDALRCGSRSSCEQQQECFVTSLPESCFAGACGVDGVAGCWPAAGSHAAMAKPSTIAMKRNFISSPQSFDLSPSIMKWEARPTRTHGGGIVNQEWEDFSCGGQCTMDGRKMAEKIPVEKEFWVQPEGTWRVHSGPPQRSSRLATEQKFAVRACPGNPCEIVQQRWSNVERSEHSEIGEGWATAV